MFITSTFDHDFTEKENIYSGQKKLQADRSRPEYTVSAAVGTCGSPVSATLLGKIITE